MYPVSYDRYNGSVFRLFGPGLDETHEPPDLGFCLVEGLIHPRKDSRAMSFRSFSISV